MIAIDVTMINSESSESIELDIILPHQQQIRDFFLKYVNENVILNQCRVDDHRILTEPGGTDKISTLTRYFATSEENANIFAQAFSDVSAEFSIKKMWEQHGYVISITQSEIDFDAEGYTTDLVDLVDQTIIWGSYILSKQG